MRREAAHGERARAGRRCGPEAAGVTLIELVVSIVVIAIALAGTLQVFRATSGQSADPMLLHQATAIAEAYLEEILPKRFYDPDLGVGGGACPAPEASRSGYDNVCDYQGLDDAGARDQNGIPAAGLGAYRVRAAIDTAATLGGISGASEILRVDLRVTHGNTVDVTVSGYRTRD